MEPGTEVARRCTAGSTKRSAMALVVVVEGERGSATARPGRLPGGTDGVCMVRVGIKSGPSSRERKREESSNSRSSN
jgi:hypothetical protein